MFKNYNALMYLLPQRCNLALKLLRFEFIFILKRNIIDS